MTDFLEEAVEIVAGSGFSITDAGLYASAIVRPQTSVFGADAYPDLWARAAALLESLARNHALADGNKQTAARLTISFLRMNGFRLIPGPEVTEHVVSVAQGEIGLADSSAWLAAHSEAC